MYVLSSKHHCIYIPFFNTYMTPTPCAPVTITHVLSQHVVSISLSLCSGLSCPVNPVLSCPVPSHRVLFHCVLSYLIMSYYPVLSFPVSSYTNVSRPVPFVPILSRSEKARHLTWLVSDHISPSEKTSK